MKGRVMKMKRKTTILSAIVLILTMVFTACSFSAKVPENLVQEQSKEDLMNKEEPVIIIENLENSSLQEMLNPFAVSLFEDLEQGENLFISPYSVYLALGMLTQGGVGSTKAELEEVLNITDLEQANILLRSLQDSFHDEKASLKTGNSVWFTEELEFAEQVQRDFFDPLGSYFKADSYQVDFTDEKTLSKINQWVSEKTDGMIDPMLEELNTEMKLCLINAVYFYGEWQTKFKAEATYEQDFYGSKGTTSIPMMNQRSEQYRYTEVDALKGIELPYGDGSVVMDLWIPKDEETRTIKEIFDELSAEEILNLNSALQDSEHKNITTLTIPKFQMETDLIPLEDTLKKMGINQAFLPGEADFTKIAEDLYVDKVLHKAKLEVDEEGTRAAAATVIEMETTGAMIEEVEVLEFIADQPFYFVIRDRNSGVILFMGMVFSLT